MPTYRDNEGRRVNVAPDDEAAARASGWTPEAEEAPTGTVGVELPGYGITAGARVEDVPALGAEIESEVARAQRAIAGHAEEQFGGVGGQVLAGVEGALEAATGGLSTALAERFAVEAGAGEEFREDRRTSREVNRAGLAVGQVAGSLLPQGLAARAGARAATAFRAVGGGVRGATVTTGVFDGALQGAGFAISEQALSDRPWSGEAIASTAIKGGLLGGAIGGAVTAAGGGMQALAARLSARADDAGALSAVARAADEVRGNPRDPIPWRQLYTEAEVSPGALTRPARRVVNQIAKAPARADEISRELAEITAPERLAMLAPDVADDLVARSNAALADFRAAATEAREWARPMALGLTRKEGGRSLPKLLSEDPDVAVSVLSRFDEASLKIETALDDVRAVTGPELAAGAADAATPATGIAGMAQRARDRVRSLGQSRAGQTATDVVAGAELLSEATGVRPTDVLRGVPVLGEATSWYLKYRALRNAFRGHGAVASSAAARGAQRSADVGRRIRAAIAGAGSAAQAAAPALARGGVAAARAEITEGRNPVDMAAIEEAVVGLPPVIADATRTTAERAAAYLDRVRPKNVLGDMSKPGGRPVPQIEVTVYSLRRDAVLDPAGAVAEILFGRHRQPTAAVHAIREVYPALYQHVRDEISAAAPQLRKTRKRGKLAHLGALWEVPLTPEQAPGAVTMADWAHTVTPPKPIGLPRGGGSLPNPGASAVAGVARTPEQRRRTS